MIPEHLLLQRLNELEPLGFGLMPTPLEALPRLSAHLDGPELWVKRDDLTGIATGGNKIRKLRFLMADAIRHKADVVITGGAVQSNHVRQTAAVAAQLGMACVAILKGEQPSGSGQGNYLLDQVFGADVRWAGERQYPELFEEEVLAQQNIGRLPYVVPFGGSNAIGICGYVSAMVELVRQYSDLSLHFDTIVVASGSGGTQAGISLGARCLGFKGTIIGISVFERAAVLAQHIAQLANEGAQHLSLDIQFTPGDINVIDDYLGGGYGVMGDLEREAIMIAGRTEGLLVDPIYTGRAMGGLIDMIRKSSFSKGQRVLFWHTGGTPALFAYGGDILR
ncbi:MAG: D-cysteine desulfhydrase family protein [Anaerolineae bacterium]|nr:D-cysteine desulfhydrase family protein [Anaerolineae bacterium]